jgi:glycogen debranching enzyme
MFFNYFQRKILKQKALLELGKLKDRRGFLKAGLPRFDRLFGRDALISAWQLLNEKPGIAKATLEILSQYQGKVINDEKKKNLEKFCRNSILN